MERENLRNMTLTALMTALLCLMGPVMVPIGPVPVSLQVLGVFLCVAVLGARRGTIAVVLYLLIGLAGLPVFAGFSGGPGAIFRPAGGFLIGFVPLALLSGWAADRFSDSLWAQFAGMFAGLIVLYAFGTTWLIYLTKLPLEKALRVAVLPFVALDSAKAAVALLLGRAVKNRLPQLR